MGIWKMKPIFIRGCCFGLPEFGDLRVACTSDILGCLVFPLCLGDHCWVYITTPWHGVEAGYCARNQDFWEGAEVGVGTIAKGSRCRCCCLHLAKPTELWGLVLH